nr:hypothetical protein CFP56_62729 [Quercus suber]
MPGLLRESQAHYRDFMRHVQDLRLLAVEQTNLAPEDRALRVFIETLDVLDQGIPDFALEPYHDVSSATHQVTTVSPERHSAPYAVRTPTQAERARMQYRTDDPEEIPQSPSSFQSLSPDRQHEPPRMVVTLPVAVHGPSISFRTQDPQHEAFRHLATQSIQEDTMPRCPSDIRARLQAAGIYHPALGLENDSGVTDVTDTSAFVSNVLDRLERPQRLSVRLRRCVHHTHGDRWVTYMIELPGVPQLLAHFDWRQDVIRQSWLTGFRPVATTQNRIVVHRSICVPTIGRANMQAMVWFEIERALGFGFVDEDLADGLWDSWCECEAAFDRALFDELEDDASNSEVA